MLKRTPPHPLLLGYIFPIPAVIGGPSDALTALQSSSAEFVIAYMIPYYAAVRCTNLSYFCFIDAFGHSHAAFVGKALFLDSLTHISCWKPCSQPLFYTNNVFPDAC